LPVEILHPAVTVVICTPVPDPDHAGLGLD
jgi:hypothetical protein